MSTVPSKRRYSLTEYLALEQDSPAKHEFFGGEIFAMAGATIRHNDISGNIYHALRKLLAGQDCRPYGNDQRICIKKLGLYTYSDTLVVCKPLEPDDQDPHSICNPRVIFEVLSKSTESYDRGQKWEFYQQLASLREFVIVSQEEAKVTRYSRTDGGIWRYRLISGIDQSLELESLDVRLPLVEIYENVQLGPE